MIRELENKKRSFYMDTFIINPFIHIHAMHQLIDEKEMILNITIYSIHWINNSLYHIIYLIIKYETQNLFNRLVWYQITFVISLISFCISQRFTKSKQIQRK